MIEKRTDAQNEIPHSQGKVDIELMSTAKFREQLPSILRTDIPVVYSHSGIRYEGGRSVDIKDSSVFGEPAVLLESGASPCSIVIAYDDANCKIIHISQYEKFLGKHPVGMREVKKALKINHDSLRGLGEFIALLGDNYRVVVTATNVTQELRETVVLDIAAELGIGDDRMVGVMLQSEPILNQPYPEVGLSRDQIHTVIYIPREFTQDSRSKIFIIGDEEGDLRNEENARWLLTKAFQE